MCVVLDVVNDKSCVCNSAPLIPALPLAPSAPDYEATMYEIWELYIDVFFYCILDNLGG